MLLPRLGGVGGNYTVNRYFLKFSYFLNIEIDKLMFNRIIFTFKYSLCRKKKRINLIFEPNRTKFKYC